MGASEFQKIFLLSELQSKEAKNTTHGFHVFHVLSGCVGQSAVSRDRIQYKSLLILCFRRYAIENPFEQ